MTTVERYWLGEERKKAEAASALKRPTFQMVMLDVGPGEAIFLESGTEAALIDGGAGGQRSNQNLADVLSTWIQARQLSIKMFIASHPHMDHLNALPHLLTNLQKAGVLAEGTKFYHNGERPTKFSRELLDQVDRLSPLLKPMVPTNEVTDKLGSDVILKLFMNGWTKHGAAYKSVIARVQYGEASFLLTGDIYEDYEEKLIKQKKGDLRAHILKITHHGSRGGTSKGFLSKVQPQIALASTANLPDGSPDTKHNLDKPTADRLKERKVRVYQTASSGTIVVRTDGFRQHKGILFEISTTKSKG